MTVRGVTGGRVAWSVIALLSISVGAYALFHVLTLFVYIPPEVASNQLFASWGLHVHVAVAGLTLLVGPFQFLRGLRGRSPRVHRTLGQTYVAAAVIGGAAGASIALSTTNGQIAGAGFFVMGVLWLLTTLAGLRAAMRRDFASHEAWMVRSFALAFAAVTQRLLLLFILIPGLSFEIVYPVAAWMCWVPNLIIAETWLRKRGGVQTMFRLRTARDL